MEPDILIRPYRWTGDYAKWRQEGNAVHDAGLCADVRAAWMAPDERIIIRSCEVVGYPEAFLYDDHLPPAEPEGRGKHYQHTSFQWDTTNAPEQLSADCIVEGKGRFTPVLRAKADYIDINLSVRNDLAGSMGPINWAFCVISLESQTLRNPEHERTFIFDGDRLRSFLEINGGAGIYLCQVAGGIRYTPDVHKTLPQSTVEAQESVVILEGRSGRHTAALGFDQSYKSFGCIGNMCFHMDPSFGTLSAGEEKRMHGRLYLIEGNADDAFQRYLRDFRAK